MNNRNPQPHPNTPSNNSQQPLRQQQTNQNNNQNINHLSSQHQHHSHGGHPHISDYSPEWGWSDVSMALEELSKYCCWDTKWKVFVSYKNLQPFRFYFKYLQLFKYSFILIFLDTFPGYIIYECAILYFEIVVKLKLY